jgi:hypothetical protein
MRSELVNWINRRRIVAYALGIKGFPAHSEQQAAVVWDK